MWFLLLYEVNIAENFEDVKKFLIQQKRFLEYNTSQLTEENYKINFNF